MPGGQTLRCLLLLLCVVNNVDGDAYIELIGAGATVPAGVYVQWMAGYKSFRAPFVDVRLRYKPVGSGYGKRAIASRLVNYAGSDSLLTDEEYQKNPDLQMFPSIALLVGLFCFCDADSCPSLYKARLRGVSKIVTRPGEIWGSDINIYLCAVPPQDQ